MIQRRRVEELWRSRDFRALIFIAVLAALVLILAVAIRGILGPFILAAILALILNPAVNAAERRRVPRVLAILVLYGILAGLLAAGVFYLVPVVRQELQTFISQHLQRQRPAFHETLLRIEAHPDVAPVFARNWPPG